MAQKLEEIKGGGGSIRVGSHGKISSLMNRELESSSNAPSSSRRSPRSAPVSASCNDSTLKLRKSMDEAKRSGTSSSMKHRSPEIENTRRTRGQIIQQQLPVLGSTTPKRQKQRASSEEASGSRDGSIRRSLEFTGKTRIHKRTHRIPMIGSENVALDKTPKREKAARKVSIVEVVDTKCGVPAGSLSSRLKKLGFSKLSQSII